MSVPPRKKHLDWHSRGYLPHFDQPDVVQSITFRLFDSVPEEVMKRWKDELSTEGLASDHSKASELRERIARYEDAGFGACFLREPRVAALVEDALLYFDGERYRLSAWCVMPNRAHVLVETIKGFPLAAIVHSWKSFTAKEANKLLDRSGEFWMRDYHDRFIRDEKHLEAARSYIEENPVKAGLARAAGEWRWSSARGRG